MDTYNLIIIGFIVATFFLALWWAFNTIRRIDNQKNFCAMQLTSIAKLWQRAKFVPEDAKERESLYLYRDFLRKFDESEGRYPVMVKDGKVRCMTRVEYDNLCGQKNLRPVSILLTLISIILAAGAIFVNVYFTNTLWLGLIFAVIMPLVQTLLAVFVSRFNKEKNNYRDGIFMALKENSVAFLSIAKPFIVVDAYPEKFGKNQKPIYATIGELSNDQIIATREYIVRQKEAETKIVMASVDNSAEIKNMTESTIRQTQKPASEIAAEVVAENNPEANEEAITENVIEKPTTETAVKPNQQKNEPEIPEVLSYDESETLVDQLINDTLVAEVNRAVESGNTSKQTAQAAAVGTPTTEIVSVTEVPETAVQAPAEDDFSLEAIGQALDAEIARRSKKRK